MCRIAPVTVPLHRNHLRGRSRIATQVFCLPGAGHGVIRRTATARGHIAKEGDGACIGEGAGVVIKSGAKRAIDGDLPARVVAKGGFVPKPNFPHVRRVADAERAAVTHRAVVEHGLREGADLKTPVPRQACPDIDGERAVGVHPNCFGGGGDDGGRSPRSE